MATATKLTAAMRTRAGKGMARETRRQDRVPCVIYGGKQAPAMISIPLRDIEKYALSSTFVTRVFDIDIDGAAHKVLPRDVQVHPITDKPIHIDFLRIDQNSIVTVAVPFQFINVETAPGIKRGGVLNIVHHEIELKCRPDQIPSHITIDLKGAEIGTSIHLSEIALPEGVTAATHEKDYTIATVAAPSAMRGKEEEDTKAAAATPEAGAAPAAGAAAGAAAPAAGGAKAPAAAAGAKAPAKAPGK
jgi:large subunit ribosomal protein L25